MTIYVTQGLGAYNMKIYSMIKVNYGHSLTLMLINNSNVKHDRIKEDIRLSLL